jgi:pectate lyase
MNNTAQNITQVVTGAQGRFVSLLVAKGLQRKAHSGKVAKVTPTHVYFKDTNNGQPNRRVARKHVLRTACGKAVFARSAL